MIASKRATETDWRKADAYENTAEDYRELPELDDAFFDRAQAEINGKPRGRPPHGSASKRQVTLRLDPEILERFRSSGSGWQARMNTFLGKNEEVLEMIGTYEDNILDMEKLIGMFDRGELRAAHESTDRAVAQIKANLEMSREAVRSLREQLAWPSKS